MKKHFKIASLGLTLLSTLVFAAQPDWWTEYSLVDSNPRQDKAVATIGQAKHAVQKAFSYLEAELSSVGGAGAEVTALYQTFCAAVPDSPDNDLQALTLGQLKYLAKPFYDRFNDPEVGIDTATMNPESTGIYPWTVDQEDDADLALATVGQLKFVFSFDLDDWAPALAAEIKAEPETLSVTLKKGESAVVPLTLKNKGADSVSFSSAVVNGVIEGGEPYLMENSSEGSVPYKFNDISTTGIEMPTLSNSFYADERVPLPEGSEFSFPFYGGNYTDVYVGTRGIIGFSDSDNYAHASPGQIPQSYSPNLFIAAFRTSLFPGSSSEAKIFFKEESDPGRLIIQYEQVPSYYGDYTFQVVLHEDGDIFVYYENVPETHDYYSVVGIENADGSEGLEVFAYGRGLKIEDKMALKFFANTGEFVQAAPGSGEIPAEGCFLMDVEFRSAVATAPGDYDASLKIRDERSSASLLSVPVKMEVVNQPANLEIVRPGYGVVVEPGAALNVEYTASDPDFGIESVALLVNGAEISRADGDQAEYAVSWTAPMLPGSYTFVAKAVDAYGMQRFSKPLIIRVGEDQDSDGMLDSWELENFGGLEVSPHGDYDGDGMLNIFELNHGTDPNGPESIKHGDAQPGNFTYYLVDPELSSETAYKKRSIRSAIDAAADFDVIEVLPGTYDLSETLEIDKKLHIFASAGARSTIMDASRFDVQSDQSPLSLLEECVLWGITFYGRDVLLGNGRSFISAPLSKNGITFYGCRFLEFSGRGLFYVNATDVTFVSCTVAGGRSSAIYARGSSSYPCELKVINSIIWNDSEEHEIAAYSNTTITCVNSIIRSANKEVLGEGRVFDDPDLAWDYSLHSESPARDSGWSGIYADPDCDGETVRDGFVDIGADEFIDTDIDGMPDWLEKENGSSVSASGDLDGDYLNNLDEYLMATDLFEWDTDSDGNSDAQEVHIFGTDPTSEKDYVDAAYLSPYAGTSDYDGDGLSGTWELTYGYNPFVDNGEAVLDPDGDGLSNLKEYQGRTDPFNFTNLVGVDSDGDGIPDLWEMDNGLDFRDPSDGALDPDQDRLTNLQEYLAQSDPNDPDLNDNSILDGEDTDDVDSDGIPNGWEKRNGLDFLNPEDALQDADSDGLDNYWEYVLGYAWNDPDSLSDGILDGDRDDDRDGMPNDWEAKYSLNPLSEPISPDWNLDEDNDGLLNYWEFLMKTDPLNPDSDGDGKADGVLDSDSDGMPDAWELAASLDPLSGADADSDMDGDGLTNLEEFSIGTNPNAVDSDSDGINDRNRDFDGDGMPNGWELLHHLDPTNEIDASLNPDADELNNLEEYMEGADPNLWDSDSNGIADGDLDLDADGMGDTWEVRHGLDPDSEGDALDDDDGDGVINRLEYRAQTDPHRRDSSDVNLIIYSNLD
ncbi:hypothetical protein DDZ13_14615 [Coraliomargarita sinensis]|uniref:Probable pectate lyase C n=1 Tax=Coraliomargarita sinensis TaxID=2174842 RepID=A0A317ZE35_9BACT|nr:right-handed parallel beta-helix repeat-containing protein [Coraliomargarita sinensis]PXA02932.1 hypothetical protein DDZ13_14615 [Coraliomargarita sinensis]